MNLHLKKLICTFLLPLPIYPLPQEDFPLQLLVPPTPFVAAVSPSHQECPPVLTTNPQDWSPPPLPSPPVHRVHSDPFFSSANPGHNAKRYLILLLPCILFLWVTQAIPPYITHFVM